MQIDYTIRPFEAMTAVFGLAAFVIGLMIKNSQNTVKEDLVRGQNELKNDMDGKHAENKQGLAVHIAEDRAVFEGIKATLARIEKTINIRRSI